MDKRSPAKPQIEEVYCPICYEKNHSKISTQMINQSKSKVGFFRCGYGHSFSLEIEYFLKKDEIKLDKD